MESGQIDRKYQFTNLDEGILRYVDMVSYPEAAVLAELYEETSSNPIAVMQVNHRQGLFLRIIVKAMRAKKILDVGTFTGYSALSMAMGLPEDGYLVGLEVNEDFANVARKYWEKAGLAQKMNMIVGPAADSMQSLLDEGQGQSFDLLYIDADKPNYSTYWELGLALARPGGMLIYDNTIFSGAAPLTEEKAIREKLAESWPEAYLDGMTQLAVQTRAFNEKISVDTRAEVLLLPFEDGLTMAVKR